MGRQYDFYRDGFAAGVEAAEHNISDPASRRDLLRYIAQDRVGEYAGEIREHQRQFADDISYDVDSTVTERQFELWEEGFYKGFEKTAMSWHKKKARPRKS